MSTYGSDPIPARAAFQNLGFDKGMLPDRRAFIMQWSLDDKKVVRKISSRKDKSNCLFLIQE